jgi:hypothetical protein
MRLLILFVGLMCGCGGRVEVVTTDVGGAPAFDASSEMLSGAGETSSAGAGAAPVTARNKARGSSGAAPGTRCSISPGDLNGPASCASKRCDVDIGCGGARPLPCKRVGDVCSLPGEPDGPFLCMVSPAGYGKCR